jgi:ATP-dependent helicase/nuclease subunit B
VIPGLSRTSDARELAQCRIFVPTQRAAQALAAELKRQNHRSDVFLPAIMPLGALEDDGSALASDALDGLTPRAAGELERRMALGELILAWSARLKRAIVSIDRDGAIRHAPEPMLVGTHPVDAWRLSSELARLIDEMIIEDVAWKDLSALNIDFDEYWRLTLHFLDIAIEAWPQILRERGLVDPATRQKESLKRAIETVGRADHPVIALGSTGSNIITAQLLAAVARAKRGAIVLPGLDTHLDAASFAALRDAVVAKPTHPQAFLARLIAGVGIDREEVAPLGQPSAKLATRQQFVSESFRPAETTDLWRNWRSRHDAADIRAALEDIALIEAANEREEALAIAVCLREALEDETQIAALVTPDRALARRVRAEMLRWNVEIDDSGGVSLGLTQAGTLARLILKAVSGAATDWAALLAHPLSGFGLEAQAQELSRLFEIGVLRSGVQSPAGWRREVERAREAAQRRDAHPRQKALSEAQWRQLEDYADLLDAAVAPLRSLTGRHALGRWLDAHRAAIGLAWSASPAAFPDGEEGDSLAALFDELAGAASARYVFDLEDYLSFFDALVAERVLRGAESGHPRLKILGLLEARLFGATRLVLAGLDETVWPPEAASGSLLSRPMREALGLSSIDRRIGQTAHDFCQALGVQDVIITRSRKRGGAPTIPSRFLQRMEALAGAELFDDLRLRGERWLGYARRLDRSEPVAPLRRPDPKPAVGLRPTSLSVTRIETLRRDPYSIYAQHILQLERLPPLDEETGVRDIGVAVHDVLEHFCRDHPHGPLPAHARATILDLLHRRLGPLAGDPEFRTFRWPRLEKGVDVYLAFEAARRPALKQLFIEESGALSIPLSDGSNFRLTCRADRIELLTDGNLAVCDYKTGAIPTAAQISAGFSPQLTLEAAMLERGAFSRIKARPVVAAYYIPLGGSKSAVVEVKSPDKTPLRDLAEQHWRELKGLLDDFRDPDRGYPARPFPQFASRFNDYDHLARTREWSIVGANDAADDA